MLSVTVNTLPGRIWPAGLVASFALCIAVGCGGKTTFPVGGKVVYKNGKPVTAGFVIFEPLNHKSSARGEIQSDGCFQLGTHGETDGAMEGEYKVLVTPPPLLEEGKPRASPIHAKYQDLEATPLKFTVTRDRAKNRFDIQVD